MSKHLNCYCQKHLWLFLRDYDYHLSSLRMKISYKECSLFILHNLQFLSKGTDAGEVRMLGKRSFLFNALLCSPSAEGSDFFVVAITMSWKTTLPNLALRTEQVQFSIIKHGDPLPLLGIEIQKYDVIHGTVVTSTQFIDYSPHNTKGL